MKNLLTLTLLTSSLIASFTMQSMDNIDPKVLLGTSIGLGTLSIGSLVYAGTNFNTYRKSKAVSNERLENEADWTTLKKRLENQILNNKLNQKDGESDKDYTLRLANKYESEFNNLDGKGDWSQWKTKTEQKKYPEVAFCLTKQDIKNNKKYYKARNYSLFSFLTFALSGYATYKYLKFETEQEA